jgi:N-acetylglutamate synthase-like GNAT family acetyltransferase
MVPELVVRRARPAEAVAISRLNNTFAHDGQMLVRTPEMVALAIDDYIVVQTGSGGLLACAAAGVLRRHRLPARRPGAVS